MSRDLPALRRDLALLRLQHDREAARASPCGTRLAFFRRQIKWLENEIAEAEHSG